MSKQAHIFEDRIDRDPGSDTNLPREDINTPPVKVGWAKTSAVNPTGNVSLKLAADLTHAGAMQANADIRAVVGNRDDINKLIRTPAQRPRPSPRG